jgi:hypothetical protein
MPYAAGLACRYLLQQHNETHGTDGVEQYLLLHMQGPMVVDSRVVGKPETVSLRGQHYMMFPT